MHRYDGQRKHVIYALSTLLYQLHTLSFLLSPSTWIFICRLISQFHSSSPRDLDPNRTLRFWFVLVLVFNSGALWKHAKEGPSQGRSVVLDFVGISNEPSKAHLIALDLFIVFLSMVLTTIAYETSYSADVSSHTTDPLLPPPATPTSPLPSIPPEQTKTPYIIDLRLSMIIQHLHHPPPPPPPRDRSLEDLLPLPNTTPWRLSNGLQMFLRARQQQRARARGIGATERRTDRNGDGRRDTPDEDGDLGQNIPGGLLMERT